MIGQSNKLLFLVKVAQLIVYHACSLGNNYKINLCYNLRDLINILFCVLQSYCDCAYGGDQVVSWNIVDLTKALLVL